MFKICLDYANFNFRMETPEMLMRTLMAGEIKHVVEFCSLCQSSEVLWETIHPHRVLSRSRMWIVPCAIKSVFDLKRHKHQIDQVGRAFLISRCTSIKLIRWGGHSSCVTFFQTLWICKIDELLVLMVRCGIVKDSSGNLLSFLLRCGTRPYKRGTQWDSNSLV